jgi:hypothetical protein
MIPHPTTWQNARERERLELLVAAERHHYESRALAGSPHRSPSARRRFGGILHAAPVVIRPALIPIPRASLAGRMSALRRIRIRDPRLLVR